MTPIGTELSGLDLAAVEVEYETDRQQIPDDDIFTYGDQDEHFLVVCMLKEQAELFQKMEFIEVDMSMKRLKGAVNKEIIFACQYFQHGKIITLARIFCNWEGTATYEHAFDRISVVLQNLTGQPLRWKYLNNPPDEGGIRAVVMDMSSKACSGLGKHLNKRDRLHRGWTENLSHVIRSCMVHFGRNIDQAIGRKNTSPHAKRMHELATARSPAEYESIITELTTRGGKIASWAAHKRQGWVKPGICKAHSNMDPSDWDRLRANTNAAEQTGAKTLSYSRDCVLIHGIRSAEVSDRRDMEHYFHRSWSANEQQKINEASTQGAENRPGGESLAFSDAELERMHPSGATYPEPYAANARPANSRPANSRPANSRPAKKARPNTSPPNTTQRTPAGQSSAPMNSSPLAGQSSAPMNSSPLAGQSSAPMNSSPLAGQDRTDRPTAESQSSFQPSPPAGFSSAPSQGRENNRRSLVSPALEQIQSALNEQMEEEKQRLANEEKSLANEAKSLANEEKRLANEAETQRQRNIQTIADIRAKFVTSTLRRMESGEIPFDGAIFKSLTEST
ncbi:hypothetical protein E4U35_007643 [Claviceps purpurea]|nr:hypothetical protein E4U35_007643 [Claviceps purpurea]